MDEQLTWIHKHMVTIIVPIYGVEKFIQRCAQSLLAQTYQDIEYIFINDATNDQSITILEQVVAEYPNRKVQIVDNPKNCGLPESRNIGMRLAQGEYIYHCDSDDYADETMIEDMVNCAITTQSDIVWTDWYLTYDSTQRYMKQPDYSTPEEAIKGMLNGRMKYNVWNKLVKLELFKNNNIEFPSGLSMGEDMTMIKLFLFSKKVAHIQRAYYHYVKTNTNALTASYSTKNYIELIRNTENLTSFITDVANSRYKDELGAFKLEVKYPLLITDKKKSYEQWRELFPEANTYIKPINKVRSRKELLEFWASHNNWTLIRIYYTVVYTIIYPLYLRFVQ